jgi:hypothetical protein
MTDDLEDDELDPLPIDRSGSGTGVRDNSNAALSSQIARPPAASTIPPLTLRGVGGGVSQPNTETGSTEDLENRGLAAHTQARPVATPSPLESKTTADQAELGRLQSTGSGISQIQHGSPAGGIGIAKPHPILGGILRGLNIAGDVGSAFLPELRPVMKAIPGTEEHHNSLVNQQAGRIGEDLGEQKEQTGIGEAQARTEQAEAAADKDRADAAKPPADKTTKPEPIFDKAGNIVGFNTGTDLLGLDNPAITPDMKAIAGAAKVKPAATPTREITRVVNGVPHTIMVNAETGEDVKDEGQTKVPGEKQEPGSFMPLYDEKGHVTGAWDPKSGRVVKNPDLPGTTTGGSAIATKADAATKKESAPYQAMIDNATEAHQLADMAAKGNASADVDLVLSFFKMMKGTGGAGVRFTQQEQNMILGARNAGQGLVAIGQKVIGEGQPLTPEQRAHMVDVMDMHAKAAQTHLDGEKSGGANTGGTPKGATMKVPGSDGKLHWSDGKQDLGVAE